MLHALSIVRLIFSRHLRSEILNITATLVFWMRLSDSCKVESINQLAPEKLRKVNFDDGSIKSEIGVSLMVDASADGIRMRAVAGRFSGTSKILFASLNALTS